MKRTWKLGQFVYGEGKRGSDDEFRGTEERKAVLVLLTLDKSRCILANLL